MFDIHDGCRKVHALTRCFLEQHPDETFYAFAIDAGLLCLNSEEAFQRTLKRYQDDWEHDNRVLTLDNMTEDEKRQAEFEMELDELDMYPDLEAYIKFNNEMRVDRRTEGNPYKLPQKQQSLRYSTGDWAYQGFAEMGDAVEGAYEEHYNMPDGAQETSDYQEYVRAVIDYVRKHQNEIFAGAKLSNDFKAFVTGHDY